LKKPKPSENWLAPFPTPITTKAGVTLNNLSDALRVIDALPDGASPAGVREALTECASGRCEPIAAETCVRIWLMHHGALA
jgi:hypothetical protein